MDGDEEIGAVDARELERVLVSQQARFLAFLQRRTGAAAEAEEILHGAYVRALEAGLPDTDDEGLVAWFHRVLRNAVVDHSRRRGVEQRALAREEADRADDREEPELRAAVCACVHDVLPALKPEYADLVRQVDLEERRVSDVADEIGLTANNASVRLHRARRALKGHLLRACGACAAHGCLECTCARRA